MEKRIIINSVNEIIELGKRLGELAKPNMVYALNGDLGAGKTTLT
ncbi:MAG: tRNA (adenosine(37)-N6)-threonylcarbamoyltransferase complex ATPase subunit type 1 TsaE, partial [Erysipelotrichia bacterium]|nr:tRNA (adenosine(37)-N6)-threonylcarbamoyltransferase complex ATPase subunit type 1 TsaE [Erysipelotrichia bacterium]